MYHITAKELESWGYVYRDGVKAQSSTRWVVFLQLDIYADAVKLIDTL